MIFSIFPQRYQKIADERYATKLAEYEECVRKAKEEGVAIPSHLDEKEKSKKPRAATKTKAKSTRNKITAESKGRKVTAKKATES